MVHIKVRSRAPPARHRAYEYASSRAAAGQLGAISPQRPDQMLRPQLYASGATARRRTSITAMRPRYRCDRCPRLPSPAAGARHTPEPNALPVDYDARYRATRGRSRNHKLQMLLSRQRQTHESRSPRGKIAARLLDMGSVRPGCSECGSRVCATRSTRDHWGPQYRGYNRAVAPGHPKHIDECHHLYRVALVKIEDATVPPTRARRR